MRNELIKDLFGHLRRQLKFTVDRVPRPVEAQIEELSLPLDVKRLLQWHWPRTSVTIGPYTLLAAEDVLANDDLERLLTAEMVPIGYAANGDILAIRFAGAREEVGLLSHDELWEENARPVDVYTAVCPSVEEYLWRVSEGLYLPRDSFSADEWRQLLEEVARRKDGA